MEIVMFKLLECYNFHGFMDYINIGYIGKLLKR